MRCSRDREKPQEKKNRNKLTSSTNDCNKTLVHYFSRSGKPKPSECWGKKERKRRRKEDRQVFDVIIACVSVVDEEPEAAN